MKQLAGSKNKGYEVRIHGETQGQPPDLSIKGPGLAAEAQVQSTRLSEATESAVTESLSGSAQPAGNGQIAVIDGSEAHLTAEAFEKGFQQFLHNSVKNSANAGATAKTGTVVVIFGDGKVSVRKRSPCFRPEPHVPKPEP